MAAAEAFARARDCADVTLNLWEANESAAAFYRAQCFATQRRTLEKKI
jgi:ribosomal protein S18 acetylase RimI-like enzyme